MSQISLVLLLISLAFCHGSFFRTNMQTPSSNPRSDVPLHLKKPLRLHGGILLATTMEIDSPDVIKRHIFPSGSRVLICQNPEAVERVVCGIVQEKTKEAVAARGFCNLAVAGGSILKTLGATKDQSKFDVPFDKMQLAYVNHKCVPLDDKDSTHFKAQGYFINERPPSIVTHPQGTDDGVSEAVNYEKELRKLCDADKLPVNSEGYPVFDLMLLGMGDDGHVGSLHPNSEAILHKGSEWVLAAIKGKPPASITMSLNVMNAANCVVIAMSGEKKAAAVKKALQDKDEPGSFPAQLLQPPNGVTFVVDTDAAKDLTI